MSGERRSKQAPIDFSQADVDALAAGRRPATVTRRLKAAPAPAASRRPASDGKQAPGPVKRADVATLRAGRAPAAARKRLFRDSPPPADAAPPDQTAGEGGKASPAQPPPRPASRKRG